MRRTIARYAVIIAAVFAIFGLLYEPPWWPARVLACVAVAFAAQAVARRFRTAAPSPPPR